VSGNFDDDVEVIRQVLAGSDAVEVHEYWPGIRKCELYRAHKNAAQRRRGADHCCKMASSKLVESRG
jgi:hypothetical protein